MEASVRCITGHGDYQSRGTRSFLRNIWRLKLEEPCLFWDPRFGSITSMLFPRKHNE
jgi:hypothetical protein